MQKLYECKDDFRLEFCKIIVAQFNRNPHFMYNIILNDGCTFLFHGQVHKQKVWYWASKNLHWYEPYRTQNSENFNVCIFQRWNSGTTFFVYLSFANRDSSSQVAIFSNQLSDLTIKLVMSYIFHLICNMIDEP